MRALLFFRPKINFPDATFDVHFDCDG